MSKKRGLGKGLSALFPVENVVGNEKEEIKEIAVSEIKPNKRQPRETFNEAGIKELAESIKEHGVIQPVVIRPLSEGGYEIIAGERRWRACKKLSLKYIPAIIKKYDDLKAAAVSLIENIHRENLNPLEEAEAYRKLIKEFGITQDEVSKRVGKSRSFIANMIRLLVLPEEIKNMLRSGSLNVGHARAILSLKEKEKQIAVAKEIYENGLNVRETEKLVKKIRNNFKNEEQIITEEENKEDENNKKEEDEKQKEKYLKEIEERLKKILKANVIIKKMRSGGKIVIRYSNQEELNRILGILND